MSEYGLRKYPMRKFEHEVKEKEIVAAILDALCMRQNHWAEMGKRL